MRLFTGIAIDPGVLQNLLPALEDFQAAARLNWSKLENLHITTKFIGEWADAALGDLKAALAGVERRGAIEIALNGFGFYPNALRPRVFYAGVVAGPELANLAARIEDACAAAGCTREQKEYSPHMTLAKIRNAKVGELRERAALMEHTELGAFTASEFHLYLSEPSAGGSIYTKLASFPLA